MDARDVFCVLGIAETKEESLIRAAYRDKLVSVNPEDNPEGFKRLREAYEEALFFSRRKEDEKAEKNDPVSLFLKKAEDIYRSLSRRLDEEEWEKLVREDVLDDLDLGEDAKWGLFSILAKYYRMPAGNWKILDRAFKIADNAQEFKEHLNKNFVDFMLWKISDEAENSDFPYEKFSGEDNADYDAFMEHYDELTNLTGKAGVKDEAEWKKEMSREIAFLESLQISHPWLTMEKAKFSLIMGKEEEAVQAVHALWEREAQDLHLILAGAEILRKCGCGEEAAAACEKLLERDGLGDERIYAASVNLAEYYLSRGELAEARKHALCARRTYNTQAANDLLDQVNERLIGLYIGEKAETLTEEEGIRLAWCLIQSERSAEGWEFFETHPLLEADSAECHWPKSIMALESGRSREAAEQARQWRACILKEHEAGTEEESGGEKGGGLSDEEKYRMAQSFKMEGSALWQLYLELEDKESEAGKAYRDAALSAYDEAISLKPEEIDFVMSKMLFMRELKDYEQMARLCERMKELDGRFFWSYFYGQEAYEGLGRAQEVVDAFYDARNIYAGRVEIYERAVRVFLAYRQYKDAKHIIDLAEEAGVNSFVLMLKKLEVLKRLAANGEMLREADAYAARVIAEFEEKKAPDDQLAEAYLQRCFVQDNSMARDFLSADGIEEWAARAVELDDNNRTRYFLGRFYLEYRDDAKRCYEHMKICEERGLDFSWMYYYIARCHEEFKQWDEALKYFKLANEKDPEEPDFGWRVVWRLRWKFIETEQIEYCEEALGYLKVQNEKFGETPRELWQSSDMHARLRQYDLALTEIERALERDGQSRNWGHKGMLLEMLDRPEEAVACYEKGIAVDLDRERDYAYGYSQMYDYFCEKRDYEGGLAWFLKKQELLKTEEQRRKNLGRIKYFYLKLGRFEDAKKVICRLYGGTELTDFVCGSWEREGKRIEDILDLYEYFLSPEELRRKNEEAAALLERRDAVWPEENFEGKRRAYMELGYSYMNYLSDDENGLIFFQKALEQFDLQGEDADQSDYRTGLENIMKCLYRLGRLKETVHYRDLFLKSLEKEYEGCEELGRDAEELYAGAYGLERNHCYHLFEVWFYSGDVKKARMYARRLEESGWCRYCNRKDCTEMWEVKGCLALLEGKREEALRAFGLSHDCAPRGNSDALREIRLLNS